MFCAQAQTSLQVAPNNFLKSTDIGGLKPNKNQLKPNTQYFFGLDHTMVQAKQPNFDNKSFELTTNSLIVVDLTKLNDTDLISLEIKFQ